MSVANALSFDRIPEYGREVRETREKEEEFEKASKIDKQNENAVENIE